MHQHFFLGTLTPLLPVLGRMGRERRGAVLGRLFSPAKAVGIFITPEAEGG